VLLQINKTSKLSLYINIHRCRKFQWNAVFFQFSFCFGTSFSHI